MDYDKYIDDDKLKEFIWNNVSAPLCPGIGRACGGRQNVTILGRKYDAICGCWPLNVKNPSDITLECSKKLILVIKNFILDLPPRQPTKEDHNG